MEAPRTLADVSREIHLDLIFKPGIEVGGTTGWRCCFPLGNLAILPDDHRDNRLYLVGCGLTLQEAAEDYVSKIRGKTLEIEAIIGHVYLFKVPDDLVA